MYIENGIQIKGKNIQGRTYKKKDIQRDGRTPGRIQGKTYIGKDLYREERGRTYIGRNVHKERRILVPV